MTARAQELGKLVGASGRGRFEQGCQRALTAALTPTPPLSNPPARRPSGFMPSHMQQPASYCSTAYPVTICPGCGGTCGGAGGARRAGGGAVSVDQARQVSQWQAERSGARTLGGLIGRPGMGCGMG